MKIRSSKRVGAIAVLFAILLSGCGKDPYMELSDADYDKVVNYAAGMVIKYKEGTSEKVAYLDTDYVPEYIAEMEKAELEAKRLEEEKRLAEEKRLEEENKKKDAEAEDDDASEDESSGEDGSGNELSEKEESGKDSLKNLTDRKSVV